MAFDVIADRWILRILDAAITMKLTRFNDFVSELGINQSVLIVKLKVLISKGLMVRRSYRDASTRARDEYVLTSRGLEFEPVLMAMTSWAERNIAESKSHH